MRAKEASAPVRCTAIAAIALIALTACLEGEDTETTDQVVTPLSPGNSAPRISGNPPANVLMDSDYSFTPNASDADNDPLSFSIQNQPGWTNFDANRGRLSGRPTMGDVGVYSNIRITVSDGAATASLPAFSISVDQAGNLSTTLSWSAPTENEDGSPLVDLAGYRIYWGTMPGQYTHSVTIENPGITTYVVDNLVPGTYEFVATSLNTSGVESGYSNRATKTLQ